MSTTPRIEVRIVGNHPHRGESGYIKFVDGKPVLAQGMIEITLEDCAHGTGGCFADPLNIMMGAKARKLFADYMNARKDTK
jgi:hypothetical protein